MHSAKIVRDAAGVPTGINTITAETMVSGAIKSLTGIADSDTVLLPAGMLDSAIIVGTPLVVGALIEKKIQTDSFGIPFKKA